ncbi:MAG: hypothetical protein Q4G30_04620 [Actinomycetaceae bacterium]|nr:hypothetical protein [Actinomycetaceae bacterium]
MNNNDAKVQQDTRTNTALPNGTPNASESEAAWALDAVEHTEAQTKERTRVPRWPVIVISFAAAAFSTGALITSYFFTNKSWQWWALFVAMLVLLCLVFWWYIRFYTRLPYRKGRLYDERSALAGGIPVAAIIPATNFYSPLLEDGHYVIAALIVPAIFAIFYFSGIWFIRYIEKLANLGYYDSKVSVWRTPREFLKEIADKEPKEKAVTDTSEHGPSAAANTQNQAKP